MVTKSNLMKLGADQLSDILMELHAQDKEIKKILEFRVAASDTSSKKLVSLIKKEIDSVKSSHKIYFYESSKFLQRKLEDIRHHIVTYLVPLSAQEALKLMNSFIGLQESVFNRVDDSCGSYGDIFREACCDLGLIYQKADICEDAMVAFVCESLAQNDYSVFDELIPSMKDALGAQGLAALKEALLHQGTRYKYMLNVWLKQIADCTKDPDEYIKLCGANGRLSNSDILEVAARLIAVWREKEALSYLERFELNQGYGSEVGYRELKIQALELAGDYKAAQEERYVWFSRSLSSEAYGTILSHADVAEKKKFKQDAIESALRYPQALTALWFFYQAQEYEWMAQLVKERIAEFTGDEYYQLRPAAYVLEQVDPLAATLVYRKLALPIMEKANSKYYTYSAQDIVKCIELNEKISCWEHFQTHASYFDEFARAHDRKTSFWSKYNAELLKRKKIPK